MLDPQDFEISLHKNNVHPSKWLHNLNIINLPKYQYLAPKSETPEMATVNIFTNGSKSNGNTEAAFVVFENNEETHTQLYRLSNNNSVFEAEIFAIIETAKFHHLYQYQTTIIWTESLSALLALCNPQPSSLLVRNLQQLLRFTYNCYLTLAWIKLTWITMVMKKQINSPKMLQIYQKN